MPSANDTVQQSAVDDATIIEESPATPEAADIEAHSSGAPSRELKKGEKVPYEVLRLIPRESAEHYHLVPLSVRAGVLEVGMVDPDDISGVDALNFITRKSGMPYKIFRISKHDLDTVLAMYEGLTGDVESALIGYGSGTPGDTGSAPSVADSGDQPLDLDAPAESLVQADTTGKRGQAAADIKEDAPAIKLASTILRYAIDGKASDVHIEPTSSGVRVRYRVDGTLHTSVVLPYSVHRSLVARVKVLASIRLDEQRKPQDGRFAAEIDNRKIDFRVSTFPSYYGEKVVIRILDREQGFIPLDKLGLSKHMLETIRAGLKQPHGLILISGPTGSGKSTTLYSMLAELDKEGQNVLSLEDPIEYNMEGVTQSQVRPEIGYTFANGLRTTLRQDPDVIMVGEIRDGETAKLAIQAALTGHLVLSTIHTNSAIGTIPRLIDMGVEPYLIPPTLILSMAQRLVRQLCPDGGKEEPMTESMRGMLKKQFGDLPSDMQPEIPNAIYEAARTDACPNGVRGRRAVFEMVPMSPGLEKIILERPVESELYTVARKEGMMTMKEDAILKSFARTVPFAEAQALGSGLFIEDEPELLDEQEAPSEEKGRGATPEATKVARATPDDEIIA